MEQIGLDRRNDLDPAGQRSQRCCRTPGLELIEIFLMRIDGVLRDQGRIVTQRLGLQDQRLVALPRRIIRLFRILMRARGPCTGAQTPNRRGFVLIVCLIFTSLSL
jgi:hypothetical protein